MVQFASRMDLLKGSEIRELLKLTAQPDIISFAGGMPAPELFPVEQMMEASVAVLKENGRAALQYSTTEGFPRLREQIAERMLAKNNIHTDADHILITSGSQEGLDFSARVFLNPGDVVLLESPSYLGAVNAFKACEPKFVEVPTDDGGMIMEELEKILATTERVKMIYAYHSSLLRCTHSSIIVMNNLIKYQFLLSADNTPCNFHSVDTTHIKYFHFYYLLAYVVNYCISDLVHQLLPFYYLLTTPFQYFLNIKKIYYSHSMFHKYQVLNMHPIQVAQ